MARPCVKKKNPYRLKTNVAILLGMGHTKGRPHTGRMGQEKETKNLYVVDVLTV
jgi:hypothetical protein